MARATSRSESGIWARLEKDHAGARAGAGAKPGKEMEKRNRTKSGEKEARRCEMEQGKARRGEAMRHDTTRHEPSKTKPKRSADVLPVNHVLIRRAIAEGRGGGGCQALGAGRMARQHGGTTTGGLRLLLLLHGSMRFSAQPPIPDLHFGFL